MSNNTALRKICYFNRGDNCTSATDYVEYMLTNTADYNEAFTFHFLDLIQVWPRPVNLTIIPFPLECLMSISTKSFKTLMHKHRNTKMPEFMNVLLPHQFSSLLTCCVFDDLMLFGVDTTHIEAKESLQGWTKL